MDMTAEKFSEALGYVGDRYLDEAEGFRPRRARRYMRAAAALLAAALALALCGTALAAAVTGESMTELLQSLWERRFGRAMSPEHEAAVAGMTQELGLSQTADGVTVCVDSARAEGYDAWLLIEVTGLEFDEASNYHFGMKSLSFNGRCGSYVARDFVSEGGEKLVVLIEHIFHDRSAPREALDVELRLGTLRRSEGGEAGPMLAAGPWSFDFRLEQGEEPRAVRLPDTEVPARDAPAVTLTNLEVSGVGCRFRWYNPDGDVTPKIYTLALVLEDGSVNVSLGSASAVGGGYWESKCLWAIPVEIDEAVALLVNEELLPIERG